MYFNNSPLLSLSIFSLAMFCSSQASNSPFWISWRSRSRNYKLDIFSTFMSKLQLNSWHAPNKLLWHLLDVRNWRKLQCVAILSGWNHFCMLRLSKYCYLDDSAHKHLMILHTNFEMFDDSAHEFWRKIMQVQH